MNSEQQIFKRYNQAMREHHDLETTWYRHLLTIAAGILAITVAFQASAPATSSASYLLMTTWLSLVLSLCSGAAATYAQVSAQQAFVADYEKKILGPLSKGHSISTVVLKGEPSAWLVASRRVMVWSLLFSVLLLTAYGSTVILSGLNHSPMPLPLC